MAFLSMPIYEFIKSAPCAYVYYPKNNNRYLWLFNDSLKDGLKLLYSTRNRESFLYNYKYKEDVEFLILEDSASEIQNIPKIILNEIENLNSKNIKDTYTNLNIGSFNLSLVECRKHLKSYTFKLDQASKLFWDKNENRFRNLYFKFKAFSLSNENGEDHLFIKANDNALYCNLIFYKKGKSNFIILIYSEKEFSTEQSSKEFLKLNE